MYSKLWDLFEITAKTNLDWSADAVSEMEKMARLVKHHDRIGIYPCNRYSRKLLNYFEDHHPDILKRIKKVYDKSDNVNFRNDFKVYNLDELEVNDIDLLIVTASKFPEDLMGDVFKVGFPENRCLVTSMIREQLSQYRPEEILEKVKAISDMVTDKKSRITYLLTWISMLLLDKDILSVYFMESDYEVKADGILDYHGMTLKHMGDSNIQYSLAHEIYKTGEVRPEHGDVVMDVGAYRGDTAAFFRHYVGDSGAIYAFEPDRRNYAYLLENIEANRATNIIAVPKALFDAKTTCNLISTPESSSFLYVIKDHLDTDEFSRVEAITLDDFVRSEQIRKVDFIKSDIEGCEIEMLSGGADTIRMHKPKLALAMYHSISDMLDIPLYVKKLNPSYDIYIRHLNFQGSPWEIILFAREKGNNVKAADKSSENRA